MRRAARRGLCACSADYCIYPDANLSPDNQWMIYSSITPYVHLVPTTQEVDSRGTSHSDNQVMLDFSNRGHDDAGVRWRSGVRVASPAREYLRLC